MDTKLYYTEIQKISPSFFLIHISQMLNVFTTGLVDRDMLTHMWDEIDYHISVV
jgi:hypothetical protein